MVCRIFSWGMWTLSCSMWDLIPWPGIEPGTPALGTQSLSHWTTKESESERVKVTQSCLTLFDPMDYTVWNSPGQNTGVRSLSLLQGIVPTQGLNPSLLRCRQILYQLSHKENPRILQWVAYAFSSGSSGPTNRTRVSCIAGRFFTNWAMREAPVHLNQPYILDVKNWPHIW